jgi:hypothetical protein
MLKTVKTLLDGADNVVRLIGVAANLALVSAFAWATNKLYGRATNAWEAIGPVPNIDVPSLTTWATSPGATDKLIAMGSVWVYAILALGCGWMTILGLRWCYHLVLVIVQQMKMQTEKALA